MDRDCNQQCTELFHYQLGLFFMQMILLTYMATVNCFVQSRPALSTKNVIGGGLPRTKAVRSRPVENTNRKPMLEV